MRNEMQRQTTPLKMVTQIYGLPGNFLAADREAGPS
jgi:hypothetical protein